MREIIRADGSKEVIMFPDGIYRSCIIDTINGLQNSLYLKQLNDKGALLRDDWRDYGVEILTLFSWLKKLNDTVIVLVLGYEGTGKTVAGSFLNPETNVWLNTDEKPLTFFGAKGKYPVDNSRKNYKELSTYDDVKKAITSIHSKRLGTFIVYVLGHIEDYKASETVGDMRQRLKILGKMATKLGIEGLNLSHTYYTRVDLSLQHTDAKRYKLTTANSGANTARSPQGYWNTYEIPNNYELIKDRILEDYGELIPKS